MKKVSGESPLRIFYRLWDKQEKPPRTHSLTFSLVVPGDGGDGGLPDYQAGDSLQADMAKYARKHWSGRTVEIVQTIDSNKGLTKQQVLKAREEAEKKLHVQYELMTKARKEHEEAVARAAEIKKEEENADSNG